MLEKYRKLANDAHLNGDRINAEYYLQFADHYFRVSADTRVRQEEQRLRRDDRWQEGGEGGADEGDDAGEFGADSEFPAFDQPPVYTRRDRDDRPERTNERAGEPVPGGSPVERGQDRPPAQPNYGRRDEHPAGDAPGNRQQARNYGQEGLAPAGQGWNGDALAEGDGGADATAYEPAENPFLRENRGARGLRPRREDRRPRREDRPETGTAGERNAGDISSETPETDRTMRAIAAGIDPDSLPPSFTVPRDEPVASEAAPAPRRRARRKPAAEPGDGPGADEPLQSLI